MSNYPRTGLEMTGNSSGKRGALNVFQEPWINISEDYLKK